MHSSFQVRRKVCLASLSCLLGRKGQEKTSSALLCRVAGTLADE